jgi:hypothetical protein
MSARSRETEIPDGNPKSVIDSLKDTKAAVADQIKQAEQAVGEARDAKEAYLGEIRQAFMGKRVRVTGSIELQELMIQDGYEYDRYSRYLDDVEAVVGSIFLDDDKYRDRLAPMAYLSIVGEGRDNVRVRPFDMVKFEVVEGPDEASKAGAGMAKTALRQGRE